MVPKTKFCPIRERNVVLLICLAIGLTHASPGGAQQAAVVLKSPQALTAKQRYDQTLVTVHQQTVQELAAAMNASMKVGNLDEANAIRDAGKRMTLGIPLQTDFKSPAAKAGKARYHLSLTTAKQQYSRELDAALKNVMSAGNLDEANAITSLRTQLDDELKALGVAQTSAAALPPLVKSNPTKPGLLVNEYPRHNDQVGPDVFLPYEDWGPPVGKSFTIQSLSEWKYTDTRNAVAVGFIKIAEDGEYHFSTDSFYDRNYLVVDGSIVCKFRDGPQHRNNVGRIRLKAGFVPIACGGFIAGRGSVSVKWKPRGQAELGEIPGKLLFH